MNRQIKVLIVDDQKAIREMFAVYLRIKGFQCFVAENAVEAITIQQRDMPDLVVTDLNMPETNGLELLRKLRSEAPDLPVILMSGGGDRLAVEASDAFHFLPKPFNLQELERTIRLAIGLKSVAPHSA